MVTARPSVVPDLYADEGELDEPTMGGGAAIRTLHVEDDAHDEPTGLHARFSLAASGRTDTGTKRRTNEDAMLVLDEEALYVVADGMGGHAGGEVASQLTVDAIASSFLEEHDAPCILSNVPLRGAELVQSFAAAVATWSTRVDPHASGVDGVHVGRIFVGRVAVGVARRARAWRRRPQWTGRRHSMSRRSAENRGSARGTRFAPFRKTRMCRDG